MNALLFFTILFFIIMPVLAAAACCYLYNKDDAGCDGSHMTPRVPLL